MVENDAKTTIFFSFLDFKTTNQYERILIEDIKDNTKTEICINQKYAIPHGARS